MYLRNQDTAVLQEKNKPAEQVCILLFTAALLIYSFSIAKDELFGGLVRMTLRQKHHSESLAKGKP